MVGVAKHILASLAVVMLANVALCKNIDDGGGGGAAAGAEEESSSFPAEHEAVTYRAYKVLEVTPESKEQVQVLKKLEKHSDAPGFEFWKVPHHVNNTCSLSVAPNLLEVMQAYLDKEQIKHTVVVEDLQELIDKEMRDILRDDGDFGLEEHASQSQYSHQSYNNLEQITLFMRELQSEHPGLVQISSIGTTHEKRPIEMVKASLNDGATRAGVVIDCGVHAREWVSPSFCMYALEQLLNGGRMGMLGHFDFYIIPVLNPDGYKYSWTTNRMWRKNMRPVNAAGPSAASPVQASSPWPVAVEPVAAASAKSARSAEKPSVNAATKQFWGSVFPGVPFGTPGQPGYPQFPTYPGGIGTGVPVGGGGGAGSGGGGGQGFGTDSKCFGVDPNRNFETGWARVGSSGKVCQVCYAMYKARLFIGKETRFPLVSTKLTLLLSYEVSKAKGP